MDDPEDALGGTASEFEDSKFCQDLLARIRREFSKWMMGVTSSRALSIYDSRHELVESFVYLTMWLRIVKHSVRHLVVITENAAQLPRFIGSVLEEAEKVESKTRYTETGRFGEIYATDSCLFSRNIYIGSRSLSAEDKQNIHLALSRFKLNVYFRDESYWKALEESEKTDVMISYNRKDADFARKLYDRLKSFRLNVWMDEVSMMQGQSIYGEIRDVTLGCRFAAVILSPHFIKNERWCKFELDTLISRQIVEGRKNLLLPIWKDVDEVMVRHYASDLANLLSFDARSGVNYIAGAILKIVEDEAAGGVTVW
jgi:hypothetical protein